MPSELTWLGHNCWAIKTGEYQLLLDPFLDDSPTSPKKSDQVAPDYILVSHGHFDHTADLLKLAVRTGATVISNFEICEWLGRQTLATPEGPKSAKNMLAMNIGGAVQTPFGRVKMTIAEHSSSLPDGSYGGNPAGFLLELANGPKIYFACDTALTPSLQLIAPAKVDLAVVPIGDLYTMGPEDSIEAIKLIQPRRVAPAHYNTWPPIAQDAQAWARLVKARTSAEPVVFEPGQTITL